jgi:tRNA pseudouridine32 synthase/23S rRNA pseudouridine746 synthase
LLSCQFTFASDLTGISIPIKLNNPFGPDIPEIANIAATEFQGFIVMESEKWGYDFLSKKGKMFGVLVVQNEDLSFGYLGTVSGKLPNKATCERLVPSVFDNSADDFFMDRGMTKLTVIGAQIKDETEPSKITILKEIRKQKSTALQQRLFENYNFSNLSGTTKNLIEIFSQSAHGNPPSAAGECAAPKLLQHAFKTGLKPIALTEFWWGGSIKTDDRLHKSFYPACKNKCRPILEYMLEDATLYNNR